MAILMNYNKTKELDTVSKTLTGHPQQDIALCILAEIIDETHKLYRLARASKSARIQRRLNQFLKATTDADNLNLETNIKGLEKYAKRKSWSYYRATTNEAIVSLRKLRLSLTQSLCIAHVLSASTHSVSALVYSYVERLAERQRLTKSRHYDHVYSKMLFFERSNRKCAEIDNSEANWTYEKWKCKGYFD